MSNVLKVSLQTTQFPRLAKTIISAAEVKCDLGNYFAQFLGRYFAVIHHPVDARNSL
jgi:hypothetical protein